MTDLLEQAALLLQSMGWDVSPEDNWPLRFCKERVTAQLCAACNVPELPQALESVAVQRICGEFLRYQMGSGNLPDFDLQQAVSAIQEGDIKVEFALGETAQTPEQRTAVLVNALCSAGEEEIIACRRLLW